MSDVKGYNVIYDKLKDSCGVYFLYDENEKLIYVGSSTQLHKRVRCWRDKDVTKYVSFIFCDSEYEAHKYEYYFIANLKPELNKNCLDTVWKDYEIDIPKTTDKYLIDSYVDLNGNPVKRQLRTK